MDNFLAMCASMLGIYQMNCEVNDINEDTNKIDEHKLNFIILSIVINTMWTIYQYRNGSTLYTLYSLLGLIVQLYIFMIITSNRG